MFLLTPFLRLGGRIRFSEKEAGSHCQTEGLAEEEEGYSFVAVNEW